MKFRCVVHYQLRVTSQLLDSSVTGAKGFKMWDQFAHVKLSAGLYRFESIWIYYSKPPFSTIYTGNTKKNNQSSQCSATVL